MNLLETQNLFETRGKLSAVPEEFYSNVPGLKNMTGLTKDSEIFVDSLKNYPSEKHAHTFTFVLEHYIKDKDVSFVIFRSNKVALLLVTNKPELMNRTTEYLISWSNVAMTIPAIQEEFSNVNVNDNTRGFGSDAVARTAISKTIRTYIEYKQENERRLNPDGELKTKKNWDIIVVKRDPNHEIISKERNKLKKDMEIKPPRGIDLKNTDIYTITNKDKREQFKKYDEYIEKLKNDFHNRLKKYKADNMPSINTPNQFRSLVKKKKQLLPERFKIAGLPYRYYDMGYSKDLKSGNLIFKFKYALDQEMAHLIYGEDNFDNCLEKSYRGIESIQYCMYEITTKGLQSECNVKSFGFYERSYDSRATQSFATGVSFIKKFVAELKKNSNKNDNK